MASNILFILTDDCSDAYSYDGGENGDRLAFVMMMLIVEILRMMVVMVWIIMILGMMMLVFVLMIPPTTAQPILQI